MSNEKTDLVVATPRAMVIHDRPQLPVTAAASNLLIDSITATLLVVTGDTGGAGVDTLVGCIVALMDGSGQGFRVIELGTTRGYLKGTLEPEEYVFVDVADPDVVANLLTAVSEVPSGYPILLSVNAGAWKDFVEIEGELAPWIERAPERYRVLVKLAEWSEDSRAEAYYRKKGGLGRVIRCFTEPRRGLRAGAGATNMRHDPVKRPMPVARQTAIPEPVPHTTVLPPASTEPDLALPVVGQSKRPKTRDANPPRLSKGPSDIDFPPGFPPHGRGAGR